MLRVLGTRRTFWVTSLQPRQVWSPVVPAGARGKLRKAPRCPPTPASPGLHMLVALTTGRSRTAPLGSLSPTVPLAPGLSPASCSQDLTPAQAPWGPGDRAAPHPLLSLDTEAGTANPSPGETWPPLVTCCARRPACAPGRAWGPCTPLYQVTVRLVSGRLA